MPPTRVVGLIFIGLAVVYLATAMRNYFQSGGKPTPARHAWLRVAFIFAIVGVSLWVFQVRLGH